MFCKSCGNGKIENKDTGLCATCNKKARDSAIDDLYPEVRIRFLKMLIANEAVCPRCRRPVDMEFDIHHKAGRDGYADAWARAMDIPKLVDVRFFIAFDRECHGYIETHPELAKKRGWSLPRLQDLKSPIEREDLKEIYFAYKASQGTQESPDH